MQRFSVERHGSRLREKQEGYYQSTGRAVVVYDLLRLTELLAAIGLRCCQWMLHAQWQRNAHQQAFRPVGRFALEVIENCHH